MIDLWFQAGLYVISLVLGLLIARFTYKEGNGGENVVLVLSLIPLVNIGLVVAFCVIMIVDNFIRIARKYVLGAKDD